MQAKATVQFTSFTNKALLDFSLGNTDELTTLERLDIDQAEDLFLLMSQALLPMPRLPDVATQEMVQKLNLMPNAQR